jgi:hypothetical protein
MGTTEKLMSDFRIRKRVLRQVSRGVEAKEAITRASQETKYRKWLLMTEYSVQETKAEDILQGGIEKYKQFKQIKNPLPYA